MLASSGVLLSTSPSFAEPAAEASEAGDTVAFRARLAYHVAREAFSGTRESPNGIVVAMPVAFEARWRGLSVTGVLPLAFANATYFAYTDVNFNRQDRDDEYIQWANPDSLELASPTLHLAYHAPVHRALVAGGGLMTTFLPSRANEVATMTAAAFLDDPAITWTGSQSLWLHGDLELNASGWSVRAQAGLLAYHGGSLYGAQLLVRTQLEVQRVLPRTRTWFVGLGHIALTDVLDEGLDERSDYVQQVMLRLGRQTPTWSYGASLGLRGDAHGRNSLAVHLARGF